MNDTNTAVTAPSNSAVKVHIELLRLEHGFSGETIPEDVIGPVPNLLRLQNA